MKTLKVLKYVGFGILGFAFVVLVIFGVQALWNWLIPELFNGPVLNFWQTVGLFILSKILLTGIAPGSQQHSHKKDWKKKFQDKCRKAQEGEQNIATAENI
jgi:membrane-bound ClpP family serine protease